MKVETVSGSMVINKSVSGKGDVLLAANGKNSDLVVNAEVKAGNNLALLAADSIQENVAAKAGISKMVSSGGDVIIAGSSQIDASNVMYRSGGNIEINGTVHGGSVALVSQGYIHGNSPNTDVKADSVILVAKGDIGSDEDFLVVDADRLGVKSDASAYLDILGDVKLKGAQAFGSWPALSSASISWNSQLDGILARNGLKLNVINGGVTEGTSIRVTDGNGEISTAGPLTVNQISVDGDLLIRNAGSIRVNDLTARDLTIQKAGSVTIQDGTVNSADIKAGSFGAGKFKVNNDLDMAVSGDIEIGDLDAGLMHHITGRNVDIGFSRYGTVLLDYINAADHLRLYGPNAAFADLIPGDEDIRAGSFDLTCLQFGQRMMPMYITIGGQEDSMYIHSPNIPINDSSYIWFHANGTIGNEEKGRLFGFDRPELGLIIFNGQIIGGDTRIMREIMRTQAFAVDVPELKAKQGVFGSPYFLHGFLQVADPVAASMMDYILFGTANVTISTDLPSYLERPIVIGGLDYSFSDPATPSYWQVPTGLSK